MARSKQLGGFPTSGVFGFRQTHNTAAVTKPIYVPATGRPAHIGAVGPGVASDG